MIYKREKYLSKIRGFYNDCELIKVITGIRRCGKSTLLLSIIDELVLSGVRKENIIYINLDIRGYKSIKSADQLESLIDSFSTVKGTKYLFIDEIQNVTDFEPVIEAFRLEGDYSIFITGSNSYLLSGDLITKLTGRYIEFEMFPLTFEEYIEMKNLYGKPINNDLTSELQEYIYIGGFPKTLQLKDLSLQKQYLQSIVDEIIKKDIKKRVKINNIEVFNLVKNFIIGNFGSTFSIHSLHSALEKEGINVSRATITRYIEALIDSKIIYSCDRFDLKSKRALRGEKKYYLADLSFYFSQNTDNRINYGPVLENIVYLYAKSLGYSISIGKIGELECDFILRNLFNAYSYVQVSYTILSDIKTEDREYKVLENIRDNYPKYLLTLDKLIQTRNGILHYNICDFMANKNKF